MTERQTTVSLAVRSKGVDDLKLVTAVLRKDRKATAEFVAQYADQIYSYVRWRVMPHQEVADDLVQEVFLAAWQGLGNFRGDASLGNWLLGIARHKIKDYYRKRLRETGWPEEDDEVAEGLAAWPIFDEGIDRESLRERVRRVLSFLPETYALVLLWRYLESRSIREMAELSGKTEKSIERLLARARDRFRRRWQHGG